MMRKTITDILSSTVLVVNDAKEERCVPDFKKIDNEIREKVLLKSIRKI